MEEQHFELDAKVANVLDSTRVALNVGRDHGVEQGDSVTLWRMVDITDPDSGESLGSVRLDNLTLNVLDVSPRFCVASVRRQYSIGNQNVGTIFASSSKKIRTPGDRSNDDTVTVKVGDPATVYATGAPF